MAAVDAGRCRALMQSVQSLAAELRAVPLEQEASKQSYPRLFELVRLVKRCGHARRRAGQITPVHRQAGLGRGPQPSQQQMYTCSVHACRSSQMHTHGVHSASPSMGRYIDATASLPADDTRAMWEQRGQWIQEE